MKIGYQAIRPPCYCVISSNGCTTNLNETDFRTWIPKLVLGHFFNTRTAAATLHSTMMIIEFSSAERRRHTCTTICHIGSLKPENKGYLLDQETIRNYVTSCQPKPSVFLQMEKRWELPPETYPMAVNTEIHQNTWHWNFKKKRQDVDSMNILNFRLTSDSIKTRSTALIGRSQVEIGTTWSAVQAPKGYHTLGGSRPVLMIFISKDWNTNLVKKKFAQTLGTLTGGMFIAAYSGSNVFNQASASVDVEVLFFAWLKVLNELQAQLKKQTNSADDDSNNEILKMQLLRIVFHGWKSDPKCINDPFENDHENDIFASCKDWSSACTQNHTLTMDFVHTKSKNRVFTTVKGPAGKPYRYGTSTESLLGFRV